MKEAVEENQPDEMIRDLQKRELHSTPDLHLCQFHQEFTTNYETTRQEKIETTILRRKWEPRNSIVQHALRWNPQGKHRPDHPKKTWRGSTDQEIKTIGKTWAEIDRN